MPSSDRAPREAESAGDRAAAGRPQRVPVNMYETHQALVVVAPLPGVMPDDVRVIVRGRRVVISAAMRSAAEKDYLLHEWHYGPYERTVDLPASYEGGQATFANGQLAVRLLKGDGDVSGDGEEDRPIAVEAGPLSHD